MDVFERLTFDSELFGISVASITCEKLSYSDLDTALRRMEEEGVDVAYMYSDSSDLETQLAAGAMCGTRVGEKVRLRASLGSVTAAELQGRASCVSVGPCVPRDPAPLLTLIPEVSEASRFSIDPRLRGDRCNAMFRTWIENSVSEDPARRGEAMAEHVLVATDAEGAAVGFITLSEHDGIGRMPLYGVASGARGRGVDRALFAAGMLWAKQRGLSSVEVKTNEARSRAAFEACGFVVVDHGTTWHFWLPRAAAEPGSAPLPNNRPFLTGGEAALVADALESTRIGSAGAYTQRCHAWLETYLRRPANNTYKALLVGSCTQALEMAALLTGVGPGDEVIMPSFTFVSTANAFVLRGAVPVFVDVRPDTLNIDETKIEAAVTPQTRAIALVHYAGIACEMDAIMDIARRHGLVVIEDAAHAIMSWYKGRALGTIGDYGCFSFHYTKNLIAGECGAIAVNRPEHVRRAMVVWEKGTNRYDFLQGKIDKYAWVDVGSSFLPSEITAAVLWAQLSQGEAIQAARTWAWCEYHRQIAPLEADGLLQRPAVPDGTSPNGHIYFVVLDTVATRQAVQSHLQGHAIQTFTHYVPLHQAPGGQRFGRVAGDMGVTESLANRLLRLPMWPTLTLSDITRVVHRLSEALSICKT